MAPKSDTRSATPEPLVLHEVTKRYGQDPPVLRDLSAAFLPGTATGLVGPNGSGKTTLLRLLSAVAYPSSGRILYGTLDVHAHPYAFLRHAGIVSAEAGLPHHLTAAELLEWILRERGLWDEAAPAHRDAVLDAVLLDERRHNLIGTYSTGMIQKTQLAAALVVRPAVLLLDEPFRGLDTASTEAALALLQRFKARGLLVVSSHDQDLLNALCDGFIRMAKAA